jgi:hypothetical protein
VARGDEWSDKGREGPGSHARCRGRKKKEEKKGRANLIMSEVGLAPRQSKHGAIEVVQDEEEQIVRL